MIDRRGFLAGCLVAGMAPAFVKAESLMKPRQLIVPKHGGVAILESGYYWVTVDYRGQQVFVPVFHFGKDEIIRSIASGRLSN